MNIVHLSASDIDGGAARGAYWLHKELSEIDVESQMVVGRKLSDDLRWSLSGKGIRLDIAQRFDIT